MHHHFINVYLLFPDSITTRVRARSLSLSLSLSIYIYIYIYIYIWYNNNNNNESFILSADHTWDIKLERASH